MVVGFFAYSEIINVINRIMQDYSNRQVGTERGGATEVKSSSDVARCAGSRNKPTQSRNWNEKKKNPNILAVSPTLCCPSTVQKYTIYREQ